MEELEKFKTDNTVGFVYFGTNEEEKKIFESVATGNDDYQFAVVEDKEIAEKAQEKMGFVVLYKKFDEKRNEISGFKDLCRRPG